MGLSIDKLQATAYLAGMIRSFRHRGLKAVYDGRTTRRVAPEHLEKLRDSRSWTGAANPAIWAFQALGCTR